MFFYEGKVKLEGFGVMNIMVSMIWWCYEGYMFIFIDLRIGECWINLVVVCGGRFVVYGKVFIFGV